MIWVSRYFVLLLLAATTVLAQVPPQHPLRLKTRLIDTRTPPQTAAQTAAMQSSETDGRGHLLLQFDGPPSAAVVKELRGRGVEVLGDVPDNGLLVSIHQRVSLRELGVHFQTRLLPSDKISPLISATGATANGFFLVEFHGDVDMNHARALLLNMGLDLRENADLHPRQLMIHVSPERMRASGLSNVMTRIASLDEVNYIFPASAELANGVPVQACEGALTVNGVAPQSIPTYGDGWDGPGLGAATLAYVFSRTTPQLDSTAAQSELQRAMAEWSKTVKISWVQNFTAAAARTVNIFWATGDHGDGYPFDGPGGVLAHTFYPAPPNPEPIAGDMHFDDAERWRIGVDTDVFSVALHELGHALGLGHSDDPNAVMYPYYRITTGLAAADKNAALTLYSAQDMGPTPQPPPAPLTLVINPPPATTTSAGIGLSGSASGGAASSSAAAISVTWSAASGAYGIAQGPASSWNIPGIPLQIGTNVITVTATAGASQVSRTVTVTRTSPPAAPPPGPADTTPPSLTITSPSSATVATSASSITITGFASDNVGVKGVSWATGFGASGAAAGATNWSAVIPLLTGSNAITVKASDAAGNIGWRSVVVMRR